VDDRLAFCFGVHNHQPIGNFDSVLEEATERAYRPFFARVRARRELRLTVHCTGSLLEWLRERARPTFDLLGALVADGQVELLTGGFYEPILAVLPDHDKRGQIERLTAFLRREFGVQPRGMWLAERVWEPHLPRALRAAGVEYILVDDSHFALAGLDPDDLGGYYLTEEQGDTLAVFPISQRLRYLIPFADVAQSVAYLAERRGRVRALTVVDDGEKFGAWPGTHAHVYEAGWLDDFFDGVLALPGVTLTTFADVRDRWPASGRVYLPAASYREMGEWALPAATGEALESAKRDLRTLPMGEQLLPLLRGGFWRGFLVKYPEVGDVYWKMVGLSRAIEAERRQHPRDDRLARAQLALWRGQANDAYWHGVFGGCYLPHLRRAVKSALLEAERVLGEVTGRSGAAWADGDTNGDGRSEVVVRTRQLSVTVNPELGGTITELAYLPRGLDLADVLARRPEAYHARVRAAAGVTPGRPVDDSSGHAGLDALLRYDEFRRASLLDAWLDAVPDDPVAPWASARWAFGRERFRATVENLGDAVVITLALDAREPPLAVEKRLLVRDASVAARYRMRAADPATPGGRWSVQWNLALTAGDAPDRYLALPGRPSLGSAGRATVPEVTLVDEWIGVEARLRWSLGADLAWGPVETVSVSEAGFERIYQGTALLLTWSLDACPQDSDGWRELWTELTVASR
jgi:alpha-amylase